MNQPYWKKPCKTQQHYTITKQLFWVSVVSVLCEIWQSQSYVKWQIQKFLSILIKQFNFNWYFILWVCWVCSFVIDQSHWIIKYKLIKFGLVLTIGIQDGRYQYSHSLIFVVTSKTRFCIVIFEYGSSLVISFHYISTVVVYANNLFLYWCFWVQIKFTINQNESILIIF